MVKEFRFAVSVKTISKFDYRYDGESTFPVLELHGQSGIVF